MLRIPSDTILPSCFMKLAGRMHADSMKIVLRLLDAFELWHNETFELNIILSMLIKNTITQCQTEQW